MDLTAREIAHVTGGEVIDGDPAARATSYAIDSRVLAEGACFVALVAERDGHEFVADAAARGASIALVARRLHLGDASPITMVRVADPLQALGALGARARDALDGVPVVGITGSAGKTGTKDLTAAALGGSHATSPAGGPKVHASPGSFNNEAGLPLTLLDAPRDASAVVLEMGARARGDIAALCTIARPTVGVITNVGLAHAETLGGPAGVALTKGELFEALPKRGLGVLDADDAATTGIAARTSALVVQVSARGTAGVDIRAADITLDGELRPAFTLETPWGTGRVQLSVHGDHQVVNALQAAAVALHLQVPFADVVGGLEAAQPAPWRMEILHTPTGAVVLNDAYNANPSSMAAAVRALAQIDTDGRRVAVLGDMRELGEHSAEEHGRLGRLAAQLGIDVVVAVGAEAAPIAEAAERNDATRVVVVADAEGALQAMRELLQHDDAVLVKGSRAVGLEALADAIARGDVVGAGRSTDGPQPAPERVR